MDTQLQELRARLAAIDDLESAAYLLQWDQATYMPPGGAAARARQLATLRRLAHEKQADAALGALLEALRPFEASLPYDSDEAGLVRAARRAHEQATPLPPALLGRIYGHGAEAYQAWTQARPADDLAAVQPYLEQTLELSREYAACFADREHVADPLIERYDYGLNAATVQALFAELREQLLPLIKAIADQPRADVACLHQTFPQAQQLAFGLEVIRRFGYDFDRGRQDKTHHPFMTKFSLGDVRITTRLKEDDLSEALFSTLHEAGHAMYEQGIRAAYEGTPLAAGASSGVHESQSRLWENLVGRSRGFWQFHYPRLQALFPDQLGSVALDTFYRAINRVEPSLIRTAADEITYNLHVMIRFELELALLEGQLTIRELPDAWRERYAADLGLAPADHRHGVLQDVHWFADLIGGVFQGYTLGNVMSAQFYDAALHAHPEIPSEIEQGQFATLRGWLQEHIYQHGAKYTAAELLERATGRPLTIEPYLQYLRTKYGELYRLP